MSEPKSRIIEDGSIIISPPKNGVWTVTSVAGARFGEDRITELQVGDAQGFSDGAIKVMIEIIEAND